MILEPMSDNIIVKVFEENQEKTASGIFLPKASQEKSNRGRVVSVGTGRMLNNGTKMDPIVKPGDDIMFSKFAGTEIISNDEKYLLIKENDILVRILEE